MSEARVITCASCDRENEDHYKFCLGCGANLDEQRESGEEEEEDASDASFCPSCGAEVIADQRFCGSCGFRLDSDSDSETEPDPEPEKPKESTKGKKKAAPREPTPPPSATPIAGRLIMVNPDGSPGDSFDLVPGENVIGRDSDVELFSRDPFLSPQHAKFEVDGETAVVTDLDALNGVFYRITEISEVEHGDFVRIGQELLRFVVLANDDVLVEAAKDGTTAGGSNPLGAWGKLERISAPGGASQVFMLRGAETNIGRERGDILFRGDGYVSGKHARIFQDSGRFFIEDLKSSNGTFLRVRGSRSLGSGSLILMGQQPFRLQLD